MIGFVYGSRIDHQAFVPHNLGDCRKGKVHFSFLIDELDVFLRDPAHANSLRH
jgi:hypothetical protein